MSAGIDGPRRPALVMAALLSLFALPAAAAAQATAGPAGSELHPVGPLSTTRHVIAPPQVALEAKLLAPSAEASDFDQFGFAVALMGATLFVGAPLDDTAGENCGAVYVFSRAAGVWSLVDVLLPADANAGQQFGKSLAADAGTGSLVVGSPADGDVVPFRGSAYVFTRDARGAWVESAKLTSPDAPAENIVFGMAVARQGATIVVGAPLEDNDIGLKVGNVYVFEQAQGAWTQVAKLFPDVNDTPDGATFGNAVAVDGERLVVGAPYIGTDFIYGRAYIFARGASGWAHEQDLYAPILLGRDRFGGSVAIRGLTTVVGAPRDAPPGVGTIASFRAVPDGAGGYDWPHVEATLAAPESTWVNRFGSSAAFDDAGGRLVVGAPNQQDQGAAYLYGVSDGEATWLSEFSAADSASFDAFGATVAIDGALVAVGAPFHDAAALDAGAVYVFTAPSAVSWTHTVRQR